ncbi:MAG: molecular chaperone DjiA [Paludibacteraceae bacterium]|nr:molecular chaperone DjiA [Paludibacteraceae bacterium]
MIVAVILVSTVLAIAFAAEYNARKLPGDDAIWNDNRFGLVSLLAIVMRADGEVSENEVLKACSFFKCSFSDDEKRRAAFACLKQELKSDANKLYFVRTDDAYKISQASANRINICAALAKKNLNRHELSAVVEFLFSVACVGGVTPREWMVISRVIELFSLPADDVKYYRTCYRSEQTDDFCDPVFVEEKDEKRQKKKMNAGQDRRSKSNNQQRKAGSGGDSSQKQSAGKAGAPASLDVYYAVLGLAATASADEVKLAYRNLVKKYHPDMVKDELLKVVYTEKVKKINDAYNHLRVDK